MQYSITKFNFKSNKINDSGISGLVYKDVDFLILPETYDLDKRSSKDISALSYSRFLSGNGEFNPEQTTDNNKDLWYSTAIDGPKLTVQEPNHIILTESQRGGLNTSNLVKYSLLKPEECVNFNYNQRYHDLSPEQTTPESWNPYIFDSEYCKKIGISPKNKIMDSEY
jgi:hypothetical protein